MYENGLESFTMHSRDVGQGPTIAAINEELASAGSLSLAPPQSLDPETAARRYLNQMIASPEVPALSADESIGNAIEYRTIGTESVPLTGTKIVKFAQYRQRIPVYGSLVVIELDEDNSMLAINSSLGNPDDVDPVASVSPAQAQHVIVDDAGPESLPLADPPRLYFYFDNRANPGRWRLAYISKNVLRHRDDEEQDGPSLPELFDYVIDAHTGEFVIRLPRTQSATWSPAEADVTDGLGTTRRIRIQRDQNGNERLHDAGRRIQTYDFEFRRLESQFSLLPGRPVVKPPAPWDPGAVSAHANAQEVADFFRDVLQRDGLDGLGGSYISSINCTSIRDQTPQQWRNAAWVGTQMVYGQRRVDGHLRSYAVAKDVVAHEMTHGLTDKTARLEYRDESGALNESYSDIFGVIIENEHESDIDKWNWEMGEDLDGSGIPLRNLRNPRLRGQPMHMDDFLETDSDNGGVHTNSGIHNRAAFELITAKRDGMFVFTARDVAILFYHALTHHLSRTSNFNSSRNGVMLAAMTLFRNDPDLIRSKKLAAIDDAFESVGVSVPAEPEPM